MQKVKVQDGIIRYVATDPTLFVDFSIIGQANVSRQLNVGDDPLAAGNITTPNGIDLQIIPGTGGDLVMAATAGGQITLNNASWPTGAVTPDVGMYIGASALNTLEYYPFTLDFTANDSLTVPQLNAAYPTIQPGQRVVGTTVIYECVAPSQWRIVGNGGGGGGGTVTSVNISSPLSTLQASGGPITTSGTLTVDLLPTGVSPGSYTTADITVDSYGRITSVSNGTGTGGTVTSVGISSSTGTITVGGGPITTTGTLTVNLPVTGVLSGSYTNADITVDAYGRITAVSNGTAGLLPVNPTEVVFGDTTLGTVTSSPNLIFNSGTSVLKVGTAQPGLISSEIGQTMTIEGDTGLVLSSTNGIVSVAGTGSALISSNVGQSMTIDGDTNLLLTSTSGSVAGGNPSLPTSATSGFFYIPTTNGTPTGTPATITGMAPMVVDVTTDQLYIYIAGTWRAITLL